MDGSDRGGGGVTRTRARARRNSDLTVTDQFCGAGGSSIGAAAQGLRVRLALNHWDLAVETHNTNFPDTDHDCVDVSAADPRRYPSTDILITSPECTTHSPAGGTRRSTPQRDLFLSQADDPATARSRATMWDVPRFAEYHDYRIVITENVVEVLRWPLFTVWLTAMETLGYLHQIVCLNSMFCHPTPQSRDRCYIVFWKKGNRAPDLTHRPMAPCARCGNVEALQAWKPGRRTGKYGRQYVYQCSKCHAEVKPYYFAALNALDLTIPAERIGDRSNPLRPRTMERIRYGLQRYGRTGLVVRTNMTTDGGRVKHLLESLPTQTASWLDGLAVPPGFLVETTRTNEPKHRPRGLEESLPSQTGQASAALVGLPFMLSAGSNISPNRPVDEAMPTQTATERFGLVLPPATMVAARNNNVPRTLADPLHVVCTGGHHMLVSGAALLNLRGEASREGAARSLSDPLASQVASAVQDWLIHPPPFLTGYYGTAKASGIDGPLPTVTTLDRHAVLGPEAELRLEDCFFRMLQPPEIGAGMAFPREYKVCGNKRDQVKQYGNAVTPPAMHWLIGQCVASLHPERAR